MKAKQFLILLLLCLHVCTILVAQSGFLHLDKPYYFNGEYIFYSVFLENAQTDSSLILLRMMKEGELMDEHFQTQVNGHFSGYFKFPHELPTGTYDLQAFAFEAKTGQALNIFNAPVSVFGEDSPDERPQYYVSADPVLSSLQGRVARLSFSNEDVSIEEGVSCTLDFISKDVKSFSVGIRKFTPDGGFISNFRHLQHNLHQKECMTLLPVLGYKVPVDHSDTGDTIPSQSSLLYAFQPKALQFQLASADQTGSFTFGFPRMYGNSVIQFLDFFLSVPVKVNRASIPQPGRPEQVSIKDTTLVEEYVLHQKRKKIYQLYNQLPHQVLVHEPEKPFVQQEPDFEVDVQDYDVKGKLADLFAEFVSPLNFQKKEEKYEIKVYYKIRGQPAFHKYPTLFIVNGVATQDVNFINSLTLQEVERVKIYSELSTLQSVIGSYNIGGLVVIDLIDHLFKLPQALALPSMKIIGLQRPIKYPIRLDSKDLGIPRIQSLVYWSPHNKVNDGDSYNFQFPAPELLGKYSMDVLIQDSSGRMHVKSFPVYHSKAGWQILDN